jgi:glutathione S-transferase
VTAVLPALYSFRRCPYAIRARLALAVSGVQYELREVSLKSKPAELLAASPKGTVPVLILPGGRVIDESLDIMRWALGQNDPDGWLTAGSQEDVQALIAGNDGPFKHALDRYKYPNRHPMESGGDAKAFALMQRGKGEHWLQKLDACLDEGCLSGARASLADMACLPFVRQFAHTDPAWFAAQIGPRLQLWLAEFEASPLFESVMGKHQPWLKSI